MRFIRNILFVFSVVGLMGACSPPEVKRASAPTDWGLVRPVLGSISTEVQPVLSFRNQGRSTEWVEVFLNSSCSGPPLVSRQVGIQESAIILDSILLSQSGDIRFFYRTHYRRSLGSPCLDTGLFYTLQALPSFPQLAWSGSSGPSSHDFGSIPLNHPSPPVQTITLTNSGGSAATGCSAPVVSNGNFVVVPGTDQCGTGDLAAGGTCTVQVRPDVTLGPGTYTGTLSRTCGNVTLAPTLSLSVTLTTPQLAWSNPSNQTSHAFGNVLNQTPSPPVVTLTLTNSGNGSATGCSAPVVSNGNFVVVPGTDQCGTGDLAAGGTCTVQVRPDVTLGPGTYTGTLSRTCGNVTLAPTLSLSVTLANPVVDWALASAPTSVITSHAYGSLLASGNVSRTFRVTNNGSVDVTGCSISLTQTLAYSFDSILSQDCRTVSSLSQGGGYCEVPVIAQSSSGNGAFSGKVRWTCTGGGTKDLDLSHSVVALAFEPTPTPVGSPSNTPYLFPATSVGQNSAAQTITLRNPSTLSSASGCAFSLVGNDPGEFTIVSTNCGSAPFNLGAGTGCTADLRASPSSSGNKSARIQVSCSATGGSLTSDLLSYVTAVPPNAPEGLGVPHVSDSEITLSWFDRSTDEDGFIIERCAGQGCTQFSVLTTIPSTTSSPTRFETRYSDAGGGLAANGYYRYRIRAYRTVNGSDFFSSYLGPTEDIYTAKDIAPPCFYLRNSNSATQKGSVRRIARYGNRIYVAGEFNLAGPCSGPVQAIDEITLKPLDGVPGMGSGELFTQPLIYDVTEDPSDTGAYFVAGDQNLWVAGKNRTRVWRIKSNGKLDSSWGTGLTVSGRVNSIAVVGNVVYLAGTFTSVNGSTRNRLAALTRTTGALLNWNPGADSAVNLIRPSSDQSKVFVAGSFNQLGLSLSRQGIGALKLSTGVTGDGADPTGNTAVETWYPGAVTGGTILHFEPVGGSLFISGSFTQIGANARSRVAGIQESDGSVLTHPSITPNGNIHSSAYDSSRGLLFVVGAFTTINGTNRNYIAAIQVSDSALHSWYPTGGAGQAIPPNSSSINASSLELKGNRLFVGISPVSTGSLGGVTTGGLAIVDLGSAVNPATSLSASRVVGTGYAGYGIKKSTGSSRLFCFSASGSVSPAVMMSGHGVSNLAVYESHTGRILPSLSPTFNGVIHAAETFGSTLYVGGEFTQVNGTLTRNRLARIAYDGSVDSSWNPNVDGIVRTIAFDGEWVHIGGGFANVGGQSRRFVASISPSLGSSNAWNSEPDGTVRKLLLHQDRIYLGGDFSNLGSDAIKGVACYSMSSSSLCRQTGTLWNPNLSPAPSIYDLWVRNEGGNDFVYLVGSGFTAANGVTRNRAVKVATSFTDPNNPNPESWNPGISGYSLNGSAVACTDSECMIGGSFNNVGSATNQNIGFVNTGNGNSLSGRYSWMNAGADYFAYSIRYSRSAAANRGTLFITGDVGASATMYLQNLTSSNAYRVAGGVTAFHVDGSNTQPVPLIRGLIDPEEQP